jgi:hypothetical protein
MAVGRITLSRLVLLADGSTGSDPNIDPQYRRGIMIGSEISTTPRQPQKRPILAKSQCMAHGVRGSSPKYQFPASPWPCDRVIDQYDRTAADKTPNI